MGSVKKDVLEKFVNFTGKYLCLNFSMKLQVVDLQLDLKMVLPKMFFRRKLQVTALPIRKLQVTAFPIKSKLSSLEKFIQNLNEFISFKESRTH